MALAGEGLLTTVYRAKPAETTTHRADYALKVLRRERQQDRRAVELLRREARVGGEVSHPHLVPILAAEVAMAPYFLVMPWLDGWSLQWLIARGPPIDLPTALWCVRQVAEALGALDATGWIHGDVKPSNIRVSPQRHVTLLDLGFARRPDEWQSAVDRCVTGTVRYMAPEVITSALRPDIRSDLYSLGVVLFELVTGRAPFEADDLAALATQHRQDRPPDVRWLVPHLPAEVARLVRELLAKDPLRRPQTPADLVERLAALEVLTFGQRSL